MSVVMCGGQNDVKPEFTVAPPAPAPAVAAHAAPSAGPTAARPHASSSFPSFPSRRWAPLTNLAIAIGDLGDDQKKKELLERALAIFEASGHPLAATVRRRMTITLWHMMS